MITLNRKEELNAFARNLLALAKDAPDDLSRRELYRALHFFRNRYGKSYEKKKTEVLEKIADGIADVRGLIDSTGFKRQTIQKILMELLEAGKVKKNRLSVSKIGRPQYFYTVVK